MNRDKAIEVLEQLMKNAISRELREAVKMGISALKKEQAEEQAAAEKKAAQKPKRAKKEAKE